jgi:hypothetical protein
MTSLWMLLACSAPDPDASGARWDTATDPRPTTTNTNTNTNTNTQAFTVVDTGALPTDTGGDPGLCTGDGDGVVQFGTGGIHAFDPYEDGERMFIVEGPSGDLGFRFDLLSEGLDTRYSMNTVIRIDFRGSDTIAPVAEEYLGLVIMQCPQPGPGWVQVFTVLPDALREAGEDGLLSGTRADVTLSLVDKHRDYGSTKVELTID